jgi:hypothetical protein
MSRYQINAGGVGNGGCHAPLWSLMYATQATICQDIHVGQPR